MYRTDGTVRLIYKSAIHENYRMNRIRGVDDVTFNTRVILAKQRLSRHDDYRFPSLLIPCLIISLHNGGSTLYRGTDVFSFQASIVKISVYFSSFNLMTSSFP